MSEPIVNLDNCAREPIHIPGAIQPHGLLLVLRDSDLRILQVSDNANLFLGIPAEHLAGQHLSVLLNAEQIEKVKFALSSTDPTESNPLDLGLVNHQDGGDLEGFIHCHDGFAFLELEPQAVTAPRFLDFYKTVSKLTSRLHAASTLAGLLNDAARGIREMTGFDRVMIYRFAESHEGNVVAEAKAEAVDPFLDLWFPASDIPEQARRLYVLNPIRNIVDAHYIPVPIVPAINPDSHRPTDLSFTSLRSVSPIHCEYLRNMGVTASMSISILDGDKLWGLVACHHFSPRLVPYELRKACVFIGQVLTGEIGRRENEEEASYQSKATVMEARFLEFMAGSSNPLLGLVNSSPNLLDFIPSQGAAVVIGDKAHMLGDTPGYEELMDLVELLQGAGVSGSFVTNSLMNHFPLTERMRSAASGLIALEVARNPSSYILFFRPEVTQTTRWGGNPEKPVVPTDEGFRLGPRKSFEIWKEEIKGQSLLWSRHEVRAASELRNLIQVMGSGR